MDERTAHAALITATELTLSRLAYRWRSTYQADQAAAIIAEYHTVMNRAWAVGWRARGLSPDAELPEELMPEAFQAYWNLIEPSRA